MNKKSRRKVLKGLAIGLPATWATPVVESILLPAHAGTSAPCTAPPGCYLLIPPTPEPLVGEYILWSGGSGPHPTPRSNSDSCDPATGGDAVVIARSAQEANDLIGCGGDSSIYQLGVAGVILPEGCSFYLCD